MILRFQVPGPPVGKARPRFDPRTRRVYTPKATVRWERHVRACACVGLMLAQIGDWPKRARYVLRLRVYFPDRRRRDGDNVVKAVQDALNGVLWDDDFRVGVSYPPPEVDRERPRVEVEVEVVAPDEPAREARRGGAAARPVRR